MIQPGPIACRKAPMSPRSELPPKRLDQLCRPFSRNPVLLCHPADLGWGKPTAHDRRMAAYLGSLSFTMGSSRAYALALRRRPESCVAKWWCRLPFRFNGSDTVRRSSFSSNQGSSCSSHVTNAFSSIHASSHLSPAFVNVMRLPLPALRSVGARPLQSRFTNCRVSKPELEYQLRGQPRVRRRLLGPKLPTSFAVANT